MIHVSLNFFSLAVCLILLVIVIVIFKKLGVNKVSMLRFVLVLIIIMLTLRLKYRTKTAEGLPRINIVVDNSYSMKYNNRLTKVKEWLAKNYNAISKKYFTKLYILNDDIYEIRDITKLDVVKRGTLIHRALENLFSAIEGRNLVVLFTDGNDIEQKLPRFKKEGIFLIPVTFNEKGFKDLSILDVRYSETGFKDVQHKISVEIISSGYNNIAVVLRLVDLETKEILDRKQILLQEGIISCELSFVPKRIGKYKLRVELQNLPQEITTENNLRDVHISVKKNKLRVLYICGQPSPEYFHLRNLLKNEPSIELVSFVILRNPESVVIVPDEDLALIPFPVHDIFVKELFNYDLLIFENFTYRGFWITYEHLDNIRKFVISGGGFIMIAGKNSFFLGGYKFTPIEEILPVVIDEKEQLVYVEYKPEVVDYNHFITKVYDEDTKNKSAWKELPNLANYQKVAGVKPQATVLLRYGDNPIMCYHNVGKGKVFASMTNTTWRWVLGNLVSNRYDYKYLHNKLWKTIVYYMAGAEDLKPLYIVCNDRFNIAEQAKINLVSSVTLSKTPKVSIIYPDKRHKDLYPSKVSDTIYISDFFPELEGRYTIVATANHAGSVFKDQKEVTVGWQSYAEMSKLSVNYDYLRELALMYNAELKFIDDFDLEKTVAELKHKFRVELVTKFDISKYFPIGFLFVIVFLLEICFVRFK